MSDTLNSGAVKSSTVENDSPATLIGSPTSSNETKQDYGLDANSEMEDNAGATRTVGAALAAVDANTAKTADLSEDGSKYTGDVSGASFTSTDGKTTDTGAGVLQRVQNAAGTLSTIGKQVSDLSADGTKYSGDVTGATGGVKVQTAPADLTAAPTAADINSLIAALKAAGVFE